MFLCKICSFNQLFSCLRSIMAKQKFVSEWTREFKWIVEGKNEYHARCTYCDQQINLSTSGKPTITQHNDSDKHQRAAKSASENSTVTSFFKSSKWTFDEEKVAAEGSWAYHIATHGQSFLSANCVSSKLLFQKMFPDSSIAKNFSNAWVKTSMIVNVMYIIR